jgi:polyhydroxyalkanoate synthesis regulator phasin
MSNNNVRSVDVPDIGIELKEDKVRLSAEVRNLQRKLEKVQQKLENATKDKLTLSVAKTYLEGEVRRLEKDIDRLNRNVQSLQSMKWNCEICTLVLTIFSAISPIFFLYWWSIVGFYCLIFCIVFAIGYIMYCTRKNKEKIVPDVEN